MKFPHSDMPLDDLCDVIHRTGQIWLNNRDLLLLEELIRRAKKTAGAPTGDHHGRHQPVCDVPGDSAGSDVHGSGRRQGEPANAARDRALTSEEIAQIEAYGRGAFASLVGGSEA